jgi:hypothetical protein
MFIHGGYWRAMDPSFHSHMARGLNERGFAVARGPSGWVEDPSRESNSRPERQ